MYVVLSSLITSHVISHNPIESPVCVRGIALSYPSQRVSGRLHLSSVLLEHPYPCRTILISKLFVGWRGGYLALI